MPYTKATFTINRYYKHRTKRVHRKRQHFSIPKTSVIPLHIYQTWHDKTDIPLPVQQSIKKIKEQNPEFEHHLYDQKECRQFIQDHFPKAVEAYDSVAANALKADLWRYSILYKNGGVYLDSKFYGIDGFKFIYLTDREHFCSDFNEKMGAVSNGLFICKPKNPFFLKAITQFVKNTKEKYYGSSTLCVGPLMLAPFVPPFTIYHIIVNDKNKYYVYKGHPILKSNEYVKKKSNKIKRWGDYWKEKKLYL